MSLMKKILLFTVILILVLVGGGYFLLNNKNEPEQATTVGGDRDAHGCIGSAGYSWCEVKNKCLRIWEEPCEVENVGGEIQKILAKKYNKTPEEVKITISKQDGDFAGGSVLFGQGGLGEGGIFLARKAAGVWEVVFDGNGSIDCAKMRQTYGFPDSILKPNFCD